MCHPVKLLEVPSANYFTTNKLSSCSPKEGQIVTGLKPANYPNPFKMANNTIKLTDLIDREERAYSYALSETIGELKRTISQEENYDKEVKIFLAFIPLPDDLYIKDLIDLEEHGFFVEFESYADVKADKDILVWAGKYDCQKLHAGVQEPIKVHRKTMSRTGNLGVARESVDGEDRKFKARVYNVKQHWTLEIDVNGLYTEVYKIKDGERTKLKPDCVKTYEIDLKYGITHEQIREMLTTVGHGVETVGKGLGRGMKSVGEGVKSVGEGVEAVKNVIDDDTDEDEPSDPTQRRRAARSIGNKFLSCCNIL